MAVTASLGLREVVTFAGAQPWPMDEIGAADAVALSSVWEGSPIVAVETLRIGTPLVTTAVVNVEAFGWRLPLQVFPGDALRLVAAALAAALAAGLLPALRLARTSPAMMLRIFANER